MKHFKPTPYTSLRRKTKITLEKGLTKFKLQKAPKKMSSLHISRTRSYAKAIMINKIVSTLDQKTTHQLTERRDSQ